MSLGKQNVVPVDTHIHSMAMTHYGQGKKLQLTAANYEEITSFFEELWQPLAGWAQSVSDWFFCSKECAVGSFLFFFSQAAFSNELRGPKPGKRSLESSDACSSVSRKKRNRSSKWIRVQNDLVLFHFHSIKVRRLGKAGESHCFSLSLSPFPFWPTTRTERMPCRVFRLANNTHALRVFK